MPIELLKLGCYNTNMELRRKQVNLKDGKVAFISAYKLGGGDITVVCAKDEHGQTVAESHFSYTYVFERPLSENERKLNARYSKKPIESVPYVKEFKLDEFHAQRFRVEGDYIVLSNGEKFKIKRKYLSLIGIEILDYGFYNVGLGTAIIKEVEKYAIKNGCDSIEGMYLPNGHFQFGAHDFYKRNGFEFYQDIGVTCVRKKLSSINVESGVN